MMFFIFPSDPFDVRRPDSDWVAEVEIAQGCGHEVALLHFESLVSGDLNRAVAQIPDFQQETFAFYRGWMLTPEQYRILYDALELRGVSLITTPEQYKSAHELPGWYDKITDHTPASMYTTRRPSSTDMSAVHDAAMPLISKMLAEYPHGVVIKDFVKSRKHEWEEACFIPNLERADNVLRNFLERQAEDLQGGVVVREYVPLKSLGRHPQSGMPLSEEFRITWFNGYPICLSEYWPRERYKLAERVMQDRKGNEVTVEIPESLERLALDELRKIADKIDSPFFTMDVALTQDGKWIVMEIGDGQVSDFPQMPKDAEHFYSELESHVTRAPHHFEGKGLTQKELDGVVCNAEGCDHKAHSGGFIFHPRCHMTSPTWVAYNEGNLEITCAECKRTVAVVAVATGEVVRH